MAKNYQVSYPDFSKKSFFQKYKRILILMLPVVFFFVAVWFSFNRIQKDVLEEIRSSIYARNYGKARSLILENLENKNLVRLKILMYGSVIDYLEKKRTAGYDFDQLLRKEDAFKIYYEGSFAMKLELGENQKDFFNLMCSYLEDIDQALKEPSVKEMFLQAVEKEVLWQIDRPSCSEIWFNHPADVLRQRIRNLRGDNVNLRESPALESRTLAILKKNDNVFVRRKVATTVDTKPASWYFVLTENLQQGFVFAPYVSERSIDEKK